MSMEIKSETSPEVRNRKISQIWCLAKALNMNSDMLHVAVWGITGKDSIKKLTYNQLMQVVKVLDKKKRQQRRQSYRRNSESASRGVYMLATPDQKELVSRLMNTISTKHSIQYPDAYLESICKRTFKNQYSKLNRSQMIKLIETLKSIQNRKV